MADQASTVLSDMEIYQHACRIAKGLDGISIGQAKVVLKQTEGIICHCHEVQAECITDWMTAEGLSENAITAVTGDASSSLAAWQGYPDSEQPDQSEHLKPSNNEGT